jgi:hypothetical protein
MVSNGESPKRSLRRRIFICATWLALAYSVYSIGGMFDWQVWLPANNDSRGVSPLSPSGKPKEADLVGVWVPDEETAARLRDLSVKFAGGGATPRLSLDKQSFAASDIPYLVKESAPQIFFASWRGGWNLYGQDEMWAVYLPGGPVDVRGFLHGDRSRYRLRLVAGDPSVNKPLWFIKK